MSYRKATAVTFLTVLIDVITVLKFNQITEFVRPFFEDSPSWFPTLIVVLFFLLPWAVFLHKKIEAPEESETETLPQTKLQKATETILSTSALGFGAIVMYMWIDTSNVIEQSGNEMPLTILLLFGIMIAYMTTVYATPKPTKLTIVNSILFLFSLVVINALVIISTAFFHFHLGAEGETAMGEKLLMTLILLPLYILFFASPRILGITKSKNWLALLSLILSLAYFVWQRV